MGATGVTATGSYRALGPSPTTGAPYGTSPVSGAPFVPPSGSMTDSQLASSLNAWIAAKYPTSPLRGQGQVFVTAGRKYNVEPGILLAVSAIETGVGTTGQGRSPSAGGLNNLYGLGGSSPMHFTSPAASVDFAAQTMAGYNVDTTDFNALCRKWAPGGGAGCPQWVSNLTAAYSSLPHTNTFTPPTGSNRNLTGGTVSTGWGVDVQNIFGGLIGQLGSVLGFLGGLLDPHNFLRLGEDIVGVLGLGLAVLALVKGRPLPAMALALGGYLFLYAGVKDVSPLAEVRDAFAPGAQKQAAKPQATPATTAPKPAATG